MRCFEVGSSMIAPIPWEQEPYPHVPVGESGRGRTLARVRVAPEFAATLAPAQGIERASVLRAEDGTLVLVEERNPEDQRALVLVAVPAGYRGWTEWTSPEYELVPCPNRGKRHDYTCERCGVKYPASDGSAEFWADDNIHPDAGVIKQYHTFPPAGVTVLAEGTCAQGEAGRMGGHKERLLIMEPGTCIRIIRHGRLYGQPSPRYILWDGDELSLGTRDEVFPPSCEGGELL